MGEALSRANRKAVASRRWGGGGGAGEPPALIRIHSPCPSRQADSEFGVLRPSDEGIRLQVNGLRRSCSPFRLTPPDGIFAANASATVSYCGTRPVLKALLKLPIRKAILVIKHSPRILFAPVTCQSFSRSRHSQAKAFLQRFWALFGCFSKANRNGYDRPMSSNSKNMHHTAAVPSVSATLPPPHGPDQGCTQSPVC